MTQRHDWLTFSMRQMGQRQIVENSMCQDMIRLLPFVETEEESNLCRQLQPTDPKAGNFVNECYNRKLVK